MDGEEEVVEEIVGSMMASPKYTLAWKPRVEPGTEKEVVIDEEDGGEKKDRDYG
jgi:hypothetical protein